MKWFRRLIGWEHEREQNARMAAQRTFEIDRLRDSYNHGLRVYTDLREELIRTGTHRDELMDRYGDQEAERVASTEKAALRSERARKASQARWGKKVAA